MSCPIEVRCSVSLKGRRLTAYKAEFGRVMEEALTRFRPDILHTNHLFLLSALIRKRFPDLPMVIHLPWHRAEAI